MDQQMWKNILSQEEIVKLRLRAINDIFAVESVHAVEACVEFAKYLANIGLHSENYPIFIDLFKNGNHHVMTALLDSKDPYHFFDVLESNEYIIRTFFKMLYDNPPGSFHPDMIKIIMGVLISTYREPVAGLKKCMIGISEMNAVGKNLDETKDQNDEINRLILDFFAEISEIDEASFGTILMGQELPPGLNSLEELVSHAINVRNAFLDPEEQLSKEIPELLVKRVNYLDQSINPRKIKSLK